MNTENAYPCLVQSLVRFNDVVWYHEIYFLDGAPFPRIGLNILLHVEPPKYLRVFLLWALFPTLDHPFSFSKSYPRGSIMTGKHTVMLSYSRVWAPNLHCSYFFQGHKPCSASTNGCSNFRHSQTFLGHQKQLDAPSERLQ
jgi:hypothetical protein